MVTSVAFAQASSPLIPSGISQACTDFLNKLNNDKSLSDCTAALVNATSAYAPGSNAATNSSAAKVGSALGGLCTSTIDDTCPDNLFGDKITSFYSACSAELTSNPNADVIRNYDVVYSMIPYRKAVCSKDDAGNYCSTQSKLPDSTDQSLIQKTLALPSTSAGMLPNATTFSNLGLPFLFIQKSAPSSSLCTSCTRKVLNAYLNFESEIPYAPGLGKSPLLSTQVDLYNSVQSTCGSSFLSEAGVVKAAGGLSGGTLSSGTMQISASGSGFAVASMGVFFIVSAMF